MMNYPDSMPVRVGLPDIFSIASFERELESVSEASVERLPFPKLIDLCRTQTLDCALVPPLEALHMPFSRLVPGIGVASPFPNAPLFLFSRNPESDIHQVAVMPGAEHLTAWAKLLFLARKNTSPMFAGFLPGSVITADAVLCGGTCTIDLPGDFSIRYDLGEWWHVMTGLPLVLWVWACRFRAPYPQIRRVLARAWQSGLNGIPQRPGLDSPQTDFAVSCESPHSSYLLRYSLGSQESDALRRMCALALEWGIGPPDAEIRFC